ncbi:hypothetical protein [Mycobacteroides abscessus]|uniref:hypothetical protein n=1 Tax=Mycobacteroides abscessus TaxID=36809 RepID=UPI00149010F4|nr:hypothetical protein [Mycobacteroides abscessus]
MAVSWGFGCEVRAPAPAAAVIQGTVPAMDDKRVYDDEDHRSEGEEYEDDEERHRE